MDVIANYVTFWITLLLSCFVFGNNNVMVVARSYAPTPSVAYAPSSSIIDPASTLNVIDYGAVGDGKTDDSEAFLKAWNDICKGDRGDLVLFIPQGNTFLLNPTMFRGPCNSSPIQVQVQGSLIAPKTIEEWTESKKSAWLEFANIQGLDISGSGQLDAQGSSWWNNTQGNGDRPTALRFHKCGDLRVQGLTHLNSAKNHVTLNECHDVDISYLQIRAPENSPNTDGIDISASTHVYIRDSFIGTGDDCIAINGGSSALNIINVTCGPGHGISIGSLGANGAYETVQDVLVKNCTMNGTSNGARIKTWEGGSGFATNITFEDIIVHDSKNPIIIDQYYTNKQTKNKVAKNAKTAVNVTNVTYRNVHGTSASEFAIDLQCSEEVPCTNLVFEKINITSSIPGKEIKEQCENAHFNNASTLSFECASSSLVDGLLYNN